MNVPCDKFSQTNASFGHLVFLRGLQDQPVVISELHSVSRVIQKTKCVGVLDKILCVFALHFLKLVEIAIVGGKNFGAFLLQVCTHLLSIVDWIFELGEMVVVLYADNEGANFLSCGKIKKIKMSQALHEHPLHNTNPFA